MTSETTTPPAVSGAPEALNPPAHIVELAVEVSGWSPCQSKRGVVIFDRENGNVVSHGHNHKPKGFECDGSDACKATCRIEAIHAEQDALMHAPRMPTDTCDMLHVKTVDGKLVPSDAPSCVQCSKLALAGGVKGFWLFHEDGWKRYDIAEFHRLSLRSAAPVVPLREAEHVKTKASDSASDGHEGKPRVLEVGGEDRTRGQEVAVVDAERGQVPVAESESERILRAALEKTESQLAKARAALFQILQLHHVCDSYFGEGADECAPCIAQRALDEAQKEESR